MTPGNQGPSISAANIKYELKNVAPQVLSQIEEGITSSQYMQEGLDIMQDVNLLIEKVKSGNINNYMEPS